MFGLQQPQLAAFAALAAMMNNPGPAVTMASGLPGMFPGSDQAQTLNTLAQLQSLFMPNPAAAAAQMQMQQVRNKRAIFPLLLFTLLLLL